MHEPRKAKSDEDEGTNCLIDTTCPSGPPPRLLSSTTHTNSQGKKKAHTQRPQGSFSLYVCLNHHNHTLTYIHSHIFTHLVMLVPCCQDPGQPATHSPSTLSLSPHTHTDTPTDECMKGGGMVCVCLWSSLLTSIHPPVTKSALSRARLRPGTFFLMARSETPLHPRIHIHTHTQRSSCSYIHSHHTHAHTQHTTQAVSAD